MAITVTYPNNYTQVSTTFTYNVSWTDTSWSIFNSIDLRLYNNDAGTFQGYIRGVNDLSYAVLSSTMGATVDGYDWSMPWTVENTWENDDTYKMYVRNNSGGASDWSNAYWRLNNPSVNITYPNGGELLRREDVINITWNWAGYSPNALTFYLYKGGSSVLTIGTATSSVGTLSWTIPVTIDNGTDYRIYCQGAGGSWAHIEDFSNAYFSINDPAPQVMGFTLGLGSAENITSIGYGTTSASSSFSISASISRVIQAYRQITGELGFSEASVFTTSQDDSTISQGDTIGLSTTLSRVGQMVRDFSHTFTFGEASVFTTSQDDSTISQGDTIGLSTTLSRVSQMVRDFSHTFTFGEASVFTTSQDDINMVNSASISFSDSVTKTLEKISNLSHTLTFSEASVLTTSQDDIDIADTGIITMAAVMKFVFGKAMADTLTIQGSEVLTTSQDDIDIADTGTITISDIVMLAIHRLKVLSDDIGFSEASVLTVEDADIIMNSTESISMATILTKAILKSMTDELNLAEVSVVTLEEAISQSDAGSISMSTILTKAILKSITDELNLSGASVVTLEEAISQLDAGSISLSALLSTGATATLNLDTSAFHVTFQNEEVTTILDPETPSTTESQLTLSGFLRKYITKHINKFQAINGRIGMNIVAQKYPINHSFESNELKQLSEGGVSKVSSIGIRKELWGMILHGMMSDKVDELHSFFDDENINWQEKVFNWTDSLDVTRKVRLRNSSVHMPLVTGDMTTLELLLEQH